MLGAYLVIDTNMCENYKLMKQYTAMKLMVIVMVIDETQMEDISTFKTPVLVP
jgi:hypothetical protein